MLVPSLVCIFQEILLFFKAVFGSCEKKKELRAMTRFFETVSVSTYKFVLCPPKLRGGFRKTSICPATLSAVLSVR